MNLLVAKLDLLYRYAFFAVCHPGHLRQAALGENPFPLCYRETGIFMGFLVGFVLLALLYPRRPGELPPKWFLAAAVAAFGWMAVDGVGSYAGWSLTTNATRLATGLLVGFGVSSFVTPVLNDALWRNALLEHMLAEPRKLVLWTAAVPVTFAAVWIHPVGLGYLMPHLALASILVLLVAVNLLGLATTPLFRKIKRGAISLAPWLAAAAGLAIVELGLMAVVHLRMHA